MRTHKVGFVEEIKKASRESKDTFFTWFNTARDTEASFIRGQWDFFTHVATPISRYISNPEEKYILEIGYGGGRMLCAASKCFKQAIGVDVHENRNIVYNELQERGCKNIKLKRCDGKSISIESNSIDIVYSFIVFQHIEKIINFESYLREVHRVLKNDGIAVLYFARFAYFSNGKGYRFLYYLDRLFENIVLWKGYKEKEAAINDINLIVSIDYAKKYSKKIGLLCLDKIVSKKNVPDGLHLFGLQKELFLKKK